MTRGLSMVVACRPESLPRQHRRQIPSPQGAPVTPIDNTLNRSFNIQTQPKAARQYQNLTDLNNKFQYISTNSGDYNFKPFLIDYKRKVTQYIKFGC